MTPNAQLHPDSSPPPPGPDTQRQPTTLELLTQQVNQLTRIVAAQQQTALSRPEYFAGVPAANVLANFFSRHSALAVEMLERSESLWMISQADGRVLWANEAFCRWIGYSIFEFTRDHDPILWTQFTYKDDSLEADLELAQRAHRGEIAKYHIKKFYVPKGGSKIFVELFARRFPPDKSHPCQFFIIEVRPMIDGTAALVQAYEELLRANKNELNAVTAAIELNAKQMELLKKTQNDSVLSWPEIKASIGKYPMRWGAAMFFVLALFQDVNLFGIAEKIKSLFVQ